MEARKRIKSAYTRLVEIERKDHVRPRDTGQNYTSSILLQRAGKMAK